ncbi:MAG: ABC transporter permease [Candidatus Hydrogenedentes bacterium]|nr:ABC transporter permease [Candidatus Hydrogenedentota bacterium]
MMEQAAQPFSKTSVLPKPVSASGALGHYVHCLRASFGHSLSLMLRRQRIILAAVITFLPVAIPLALALLSDDQFGRDGSEVFSKMASEAHINTLAPLLALFFATMIIGEDVESRTIPLMLTRPMPRSAWVLGRFGSYLLVSATLLGTSIFLTFAASTALADLNFNRDGLEKLGTYEFAMVMALLANGALALFLGAVTKRPIVIGLFFLYGWQRLATFVPGVVDFLTIMKYTNELLPLGIDSGDEAVREELLAFKKQLYYVGAGKAALMLILITATLLALSVAVVRIREYATDRAAGT